MNKTFEQSLPAIIDTHASKNNLKITIDYNGEKSFAVIIKQNTQNPNPIKNFKEAIKTLYHELEEPGRQTLLLYHYDVQVENPPENQSFHTSACLMKTISLAS